MRAKWVTTKIEMLIKDYAYLMRKADTVVRMKLAEFNRREGKERGRKEARDTKITYKELFEAAEIFEEDPEVASEKWILARRFVDWKNLQILPTEEVKQKVIGFLNDWHCRLPVSDELANRIKESYRRSIPFLNALDNETLENLDFEKRKNIDGKEYTNEEALRQVLANFCNTGYNFRGVAASKTLSLINPYLFVMWDTSICEAYGIRDPSIPYIRDEQYVSAFLRLMQKKANEAIDSYMKDKGCSREEAILSINQFREWRPLAKLLDEYNWLKYYREI
jgi:hypothetical protein